MDSKLLILSLFTALAAAGVRRVPVPLDIRSPQGPGAPPPSPSRAGEEY